METQKCRNLRDSETSDNVLVQQALDGDQEAFEALVSRYQRSLFRLIYRYVDEYHEVPVSTVKARFHRAKPYLRAALTAQ
jgi:DNA-directed RNA polymerase specialized sigma24 family protein